METRRRRDLAPLRAALQRHEITLRTVAKAARVTPQHVCHVFAGRYASDRVVATAKALIAKREAVAKGIAS